MEGLVAQRRILLNVVLGLVLAIFHHIPSGRQSLLVGGDSCIDLDHGVHRVHGVAKFLVSGLAVGHQLHLNLRATPHTKDNDGVVGLEAMVLAVAAHISYYSCTELSPML